MQAMRVSSAGKLGYAAAGAPIHAPAGARVAIIKVSCCEKVMLSTILSHLPRPTSLGAPAATAARRLSPVPAVRPRTAAARRPLAPRPCPTAPAARSASVLAHPDLAERVLVRGQYGALEASRVISAVMARVAADPLRRPALLELRFPTDAPAWLQKDVCGIIGELRGRSEETLCLDLRLESRPRREGDHWVRTLLVQGR
jgi:hypothetical protein